MTPVLLDINSHPHLDQSGKIAVVHNGIIENCDRLKEKLVQAGHTFRSATDTEVPGPFDRKKRAAGRNGHSGNSNALAQAVCDALREVIGTYGIAVISADHPGVIIGARRGSPLIIGIGEGREFPDERCQRHRGAHAAGGLFERLRRGHHHRRAVRRAKSRHGNGEGADQPAGI